MNGRGHRIRKSKQQLQLEKLMRAKQLGNTISGINKGTSSPNSAQVKGLLGPSNNSNFNKLLATNIQGQLSTGGKRSAKPAPAKSSPPMPINEDWVTVDSDAEELKNLVNLRKFNFTKSSTYRKDADLQNVKKLLDAYNYGGMTGQQEIDLMMAASDYITKYSTGKKAKHRARTEAMEEILYQLTMHGGTKETADRKVDDIINTKITQNRYENLVKRTLESMKGMYADNSKYSKSLQMIAADVLSRADNVSYVNGGSRSGFRDTPEGNEIDARMTEDKDSAHDTTFHEFTHMANSTAYGNIMGISYLPDETTEGINDLLTQHENRFAHFTEAGGAPDERDYAISWWSHSKYTKGNEGAFNDYLQEGRIDQNTYNDKMAKLAKLKELFHDEDVESYPLRGTNSVTEYDAVVNQLLLRMENNGETEKSNKSHLYRILKAAALDSLVRRRGAAIKRKMGNRR